MKIKRKQKQRENENKNKMKDDKKGKQKQNRNQRTSSTSLPTKTCPLEFSRVNCQKKKTKNDRTLTCSIGTLPSGIFAADEAKRDENSGKQQQPRQQTHFPKLFSKPPDADGHFSLLGGSKGYHTGKNKITRTELFYWPNIKTIQEN